MQWKWLTMACLAAVAGPTVTGEAVAQERPSMTIDGYDGLSWGATIDDVVARHGQAIDDAMLETELRMLAFEDSLGARPSVLLVGFLEDHGMVKVQQVVEIDTSAACVDYIRDLHRAIDVRYPLIRPTEEARNNSPDVICKAAADGNAFWHRQWRDEETGAVVTVSLPSGSDRVQLTYESGVFREWIRALSEARSGAMPGEVPDRGAEAEAELDAVP